MMHSVFSSCTVCVCVCKHDTGRDLGGRDSNWSELVVYLDHLVQAERLGSALQPLEDVDLQRGGQTYQLLFCGAYAAKRNNASSK